MPNYHEEWFTPFVVTSLDLDKILHSCDKSKKLRNLISLSRLVDGTTGFIVRCSAHMYSIQAREFRSCCQVWSTPESATTVLELLPDLGSWYFCWKYGSQMVISVYPFFHCLECWRPFLPIVSSHPVRSLITSHSNLLSNWPGLPLFQLFSYLVLYATKGTSESAHSGWVRTPISVKSYFQIQLFSETLRPCLRCTYFQLRMCSLT